MHPHQAHNSPLDPVTAQFSVCDFNGDLFTKYVRHVADRRRERIGLPQQNPGAKKPFPWMSETMDLGKEKNFFETRVMEYQSAANLSWDEPKPLILLWQARPVKLIGYFNE